MNTHCISGTWKAAAAVAVFACFLGAGLGLTGCRQSGKATAVHREPAEDTSADPYSYKSVFNGPMLHLVEKKLAPNHE